MMDHGFETRGLIRGIDLVTKFGSGDRGSNSVLNLERIESPPYSFDGGILMGPTIRNTHRHSPLEIPSAHEVYLKTFCRAIVLVASTQVRGVAADQPNIHRCFFVDDMGMMDTSPSAFLDGRKIGNSQAIPVERLLTHTVSWHGSGLASQGIRFNQFTQ